MCRLLPREPRADRVYALWLVAMSYWMGSRSSPEASFQGVPKATSPHFAFLGSRRVAAAVRRRLRDPFGCPRKVASPAFFDPISSKPTTKPQDCISDFKLNAKYGDVFRGPNSPTGATDAYKARGGGGCGGVPCPLRGETRPELGASDLRFFGSSFSTVGRRARTLRDGLAEIVPLAGQTSQRHHKARKMVTTHNVPQGSPRGPKIASYATAQILRLEMPVAVPPSLASA